MFLLGDEDRDEDEAEDRTNQNNIGRWRREQEQGGWAGRQTPGLGNLSTSVDWAVAQWGRQIGEPRYKWAAHFEPTIPQRLEGRPKDSDNVCLSIRATDVVQAGLLTLDTQLLSVSFNPFSALLHSPGATQPQPDSICPGKPTISLDEFNHCTLHRVTPSLGGPQACFWKPYPAYVFPSQQSFPGPLS